MGFLQPLFLVGAIALGLPILLHLIHRQRYPSVRFSTLEFFERTVKHNTLQRRFIDILLLILRLVALALLVIACARPFIESGAGNAPAALVIVLDNSGSMSAQHQGVDQRRSSFSVAKERVAEIVASLEGGDRVAILPAVGPGMGNLSYDREEIARFLEGIEQQFVRGDLAGALAGAGRLLAGTTELSRQLVILSDGHAAEWDAAGPLDSLSAKVVLFCFAPQGEANLAVDSVNLSEEPAPAGVPVRLAVAVRNFGKEAAGPVKVELTLHSYGEAFPPKTVRSIPPGEVRVVEFTHVFHSRDLRGGFARVSAPGDSYAADDTGYFVPRVRDVVRALVVNGVESSQPHERATFFLSRALQPAMADAQSGGLSPVIVDEADVSQLPNKILYDYGVIVTANVSRLPAKIIPKFKEYLHHGGAWLAFIGDKVEAEAYNALGVLPGTLKVVHRPPLPVVIEDYDPQHSALSWFAKPGQSVLSTFSFTQYCEFTPDDSAATKVIARFSDERPAIVDGRHGDGRVLLFASSCHTDWTDMPLKPAFLVLTQRLAQYLGGGLAPESVRTQAFTGQSLFEPKQKGPFGENRVFLDPEEKELKSVASEDGSRSVPTRLPGLYLAQPRKDDSAIEGLMLDRRPYAVNVPLDESDWRFLDASEVAAKLGAEAEIVEDPFEVTGVDTIERGGSEYLTAIFAALLLVLLIESLVGWRTASESGV